MLMLFITRKYNTSGATIGNMPKPAVTIRPLRLTDIKALHELFNIALDTDFQYFPPAHIAQIRRQNSRLHLLFARLRHRRQILVAVKRRRLVGFAFSSAQANNIGHIYWLYVSPDLRSQKIGDRLMQATLDSLKRLGMGAVELVTYNFDGYYRRLGFWDRGTTSQEGIELHVMQHDFKSSREGTRIKSKARRRHARVRRRLVRLPFLFGLALAVLAAAAVQVYYPAVIPLRVTPVPAARKPETAAVTPVQTPGSVEQVVSEQTFTPEQVTALAKQNYGASFQPAAHGVTYELIRYRTTDQNGQLITDYAGVYVPEGVTGAPVLAMAPGTTGDSPACSVSLEQPQIRDWANYRSYMMSYAARGYTGVITDYDNMRGTNGPQPYMVAAAEGRAVLDSIRALHHLPIAVQASNLRHVFIAGYSQGGHAALAADSLAAGYAPDLSISGVIGWGPVINVETTWAGINDGSTLEWFGPAILVGYEHYYGHAYPIENILQEPWSANLTTDVMSRCVDSVIPFWGTHPGKVYTSQFLADLKAGNLPSDLYGDLQADLDANHVVDLSNTPKLINQGAEDNVVLASQQPAAVDAMCHDSVPVDLDIYPKDTHYDLMVASFTNVLNWMDNVLAQRTLPTTCP